MSISKSKGRGGARPGAGRPKKDRTQTAKFESALGYLQAVTNGEVAPDALRISAAKAVLPYEEPKRRSKPESPSPKRLKQAEERAVEKDKILEFEKKAAKIRAKYKQKEVK